MLSGLHACRCHHVARHKASSGCGGAGAALLKIRTFTLSIRIVLLLPLLASLRLLAPLLLLLPLLLGDNVSRWVAVTDGQRLLVRAMG